MILLTDFFSSDVWQDINNRVFATFGLSGVATIANAIPETVLTETVSINPLIYSIQILTIISYIMSILVASTVLYRFGSWYKNKDKKKINE